MVDLINLKSWIVYIIVLVGPNNLEKIPYPIDSASDCFEVGRYKDHYDCATAGFINAMGAIREIGVEEVNKNKLLVNFSCKEQESI